MELNELTDQLLEETELRADVLSMQGTAARQIVPQHGDESCPTCKREAASMAPPAYVYAIGRIDAFAPTLGVAKEIPQAGKNLKTNSVTDVQLRNEVLSNNRYLAREMCWVFSVENQETYILVPRDPVDFQLLVESLRRNPDSRDIDVVVGVRGPTAICGGHVLPVVTVDQIWSFDRDSLIKALPRPQSIVEENFVAIAGRLFDYIEHTADNAGATDEHRALNYLAVRHSDIYLTASEKSGGNEFLTGVGVRPSRLSGSRKVVDVIFSFTNKQTDVVDRQFVRVDVTDKYPFLVSGVSQYFDR